MPNRCRNKQTLHGDFSMNKRKQKNSVILNLTKFYGASSLLLLIIANNGFLAIGAKARLSQNPDVGARGRSR